MFNQKTYRILEIKYIMSTNGDVGIVRVIGIPAAGMVEG